jgi:hypothetical protein
VSTRAPGSALAGAALAAALAAGCGSDEPWIECAAERGLAFEHDSGFRGQYYFPETTGSGVALVDFDGDGDLECLALQAGLVPGTPEAEREPRRASARLYENDGRGVFRDATGGAGALAFDGCAQGVAAGDVDGDAAPDVFLTAVGPDRLCLNRGALAFADGTPGTPLGDPRWNSSCGFADLDRDGALDLVVLAYVEWSLATHRDCGTPSGGFDYCEIQLFDGIPDRVYRGDGRGGFEDRTAAWGLADSGGRGLGLALVDLDDDGDVDLYVANDTNANATWLNRGDGVLEDATFLSGAAYSVDGKAEAGMGVAVTSVARGTLPDLVVTNFAGETNSYYQNAGAARFRERSRQVGIAAASRALLAFGVGAGDFDRDGIEDLLVANGHVLRNADELREGLHYRQPTQLFRGTPQGRYELLEGSAALDRPRVGRGLALGDVDGDGDLDAVISPSDGPLQLLENRMARPGSRWLAVELAGRAPNTAAIGAKLTLELSDGAVLARWVRSGTGYASQDDLRPHFGIPAGVEAVRLSVRWPDGGATEVQRPAPDALLRVEQR